MVSLNKITIHWTAGTNYPNSTDKQHYHYLVDKEGKTADISLCTIYDVNKQMIKDNVEILSTNKIRKLIKKVDIDCANKNAHYFMLLNKELSDYTIFIYTGDHKEFNEALFDCIINRGDCKGIDLTDNKDAWEIWIQTENDVYLYHLFPCDTCIIPC